MNTTHIEAVFLDYIKSPDTQYALLINGSWGSGKTYFWKYKLQEIAKANKFEVIYLSLNGISKIETLEYQLFLRFLPFVGNTENKTAKAIVALFANAANAASKKFLSVGLTEAFKDVKVDSLNLSHHVICFDDLERCQLPIKETLGFINNYVEHKSLKAVILADEKNIEANLEKDNKKYHDIKEKVVGRILNYEPNIDQIVPILFSKFKTSQPKVYNFFEHWENEITSILQEYRENNLRIISFYISILEKVSPLLEDIDEKYIKEVILFTLTIVIELKRGRLTTSDYSDPKGIQNIDENFFGLFLARTTNLSNEEKENREKLYAELFYDRYLINRISQYYFYPSIYSFVLTGYFNSQQFQDELRERYPISLSDEIIAFRTLLNYTFRELSNADFISCFNKVLEYAKEGKYSIYDYAQIANFFFYFSDNKLVPANYKQIHEVINEGLEIAKRRKEISELMFQSLRHSISENIEVKKVKETIKNIHLHIKSDQLKIESNKLLDAIKSDDEIALSATFQDNQFSKTFLQYVYNEAFVQALVKSSNKLLFNFTELLNNRYSSVNIGEFLFEDHDPLLMLKEKLETYLSSIGEDQPHKFLIESLIQIINEICDKLVLTRK
ncbi:P-loop NTPase fold protein [Flaviaesturariibacter aridisoli]|uniref:KAP NTPase domain-containing protein n=1 Tax=Flaviaesturariibacter aridisoli TaxID=2545761 RepID=A0A4R4DWI3_9BACT|nr:P-loop NTPase fold protein [Flaviaesturariibacter aridisoli]TCZ68342.1 hypothetical protein E0486_14215 [Flaviaesturariibacter aridisoli]